MNSRGTLSSWTTMGSREMCRSPVIVYGIGNNYEKYKDYISEHYYVVGYCDKDKRKLYGFERKIFLNDLSKRDDYDYILLMPTQAMDIAFDLIKNYHVNPNKIVLFALQKRTELPYDINMPEQMFFGKYQEDAVVRLLLYEIGIDSADIAYLDVSLQSPIFDNWTYYFYKKGAHGTVVNAFTKQFQTEMKIYRPSDDIIDLQSKDIDFNTILEEIHSVPDLLVIRLAEKTEKILNALDYNSYPIKIILADEIHDGLIFFMQMKGYRWYSTIGDRCALFVWNSAYYER